MSYLRNRRNNQTQNNNLMTTCGKTGIKINNTGNDYKNDPFANVDPFKNQPRQPDRKDINYSAQQYQQLDLNIDHYSRTELYQLFGFHANATLTEENMKEAKKIVLKTHPDKSRLDNKYFLFFKSAYEKLLNIYNFQNKTNNKNIDKADYKNEEHKEILTNLFETKKDLKDPKNFNEWFNKQFESHRLDNPTEKGYGDWLKSEEDIIYTPQNINKDSMGREMEKRKKEIQTLMPYTGVNDIFSSSSVGGSALMEYDSNFSSGTLFNGDNMGYTDLRQAYVESVIPVTQDDYNNIPKFKNIEEYKRNRDSTNMKPLEKEEAMRQLFHQDKQKEEESAALAFYYAQQEEKAKQKQNDFWSNLKQLTNW